jgi:hypothetical protein
MGEMAVLSESTWEKIRELFPSEQHDEVATILETECGHFWREKPLTD